MKHRRVGFTLVELLVVIGIIAVLVGILLPALGAARRQAQAAKCAAALREVGNCFKMYEVDSKGWYPVARINGYMTRYPNGTITPYNIDGVDYPTATPANGQAYWFTFLTKYATKGKTGNANGTDETSAYLSRQTIFFGCPSWTGYQRGGVNVGDTNVVQVGYGMNPFPTFQSTARPDPINQGADVTQQAVIDPNGTKGTWQRAKAWSHSQERMLVADSKFWESLSNSPPATGYPAGSNGWPMAVYPQPILSNSSLDAATGHQFDASTSCVDMYRHGKAPGLISFNGGPYFFDPSGGKVAYNILYADGHVSKASDGREAYRSIRMKFPG
jgi:prepilin-type N-terminal cleavage/methylation domain-containing protein/prepilin-type processing-associated H-X9-DG protein